MQIAVVGSINTDISIRVPRMPQRHETVVGSGNFELSHGGKGANQAAAAAAAGAQVHMVGKIGMDDFGARAVEDLESRGIDCRYVQRTADHSTGLATILLEPDGANAITVAPGANAALGADGRARRRTAARRVRAWSCCNSRFRWRRCSKPMRIAQAAVAPW
ncbi:MAG: PfkB family carbohydrate kinase [Woeseiaceae bacterium]|nr:PfkB family carbohydrate kinase [Woeseiaceae bacterium]